MKGMVKKMSPKELLYIEDALGHQVHMKTLCQDAASKFQDAELKTFVDQLTARNTQTLSKIYQLLK